ncbi:MAG TPA: hypothetical protein VF710_08220 [Longimicrobium sp.]
MTNAHSTPPLREVLGEQVRAVGYALRRPALAAAALVTVGTLLLAIQIMREPAAMDFSPESQMLPGVLGLLFPIAVWQGEKRFGDGFLWTLPVDRRRHALSKVLAGWVWLMAAVAFFILWLAVLALASGGSFLGEETRQLASATDGVANAVYFTMTRTIRWRTQPVLWIVPFTAATGTYLLASALGLGVRHPLRWIAGVVLAFFLVVVALEATHTVRFSMGPARLVSSIYNGPYGLDALLTARTESLRTEMFLGNGKRVPVWLGLPHLGQWAAATVGWMLGGLVALWAAASRHRERRRA